MRGFLLVFILFFALSPASSHAQSRVRARDLSGTWKLVFDIDKEADSAGERVLLNAVGGFLDEIDVYFEFLPENELKITVYAFDDEEIEYEKWHITEAGELSMGDTEHFENEDSVWMFEGRRLVSYEYRDGKRLERKENVYIERVRE